MSERDKEPFALGRGRVERSSEKALCVALDADSLPGAKSIWIPKSVLHDDSEIFDALNNARGELVVERWFARRSGWVTE